MSPRLVSVLACLLLAACAAAPPRPPAGTETARCLALYEAVDRAVAEAGATPSSPARIAGFPYLRVNRFLASYRDRPLDEPERRAWLARLAGLDLKARDVELDALPAPVREGLGQRYAASQDVAGALAACSRELQAHDLRHAERWARLRTHAVVPPDYRTLNRVLGLYPLTALPVGYGAFRWREEAHAFFASPLAALPVQGELRRYRPPDSAASPPALAELPRDVLGIPLPGEAELEGLFAAHAPVWEIDVAGAFDRPGAPEWGRDNVPTVNPDPPVVYRYGSYTRWRGEVLLQLNYVIWFAERPRSGPFDLLGGALDGLVWRVTLDREGSPLMYDAIHPCGCYHMFFPRIDLRPRPQAFDLPEPPLVPQYAPRLEPGERVVLRVASATHHIQRVYTDVPQGEVYLWRDYRALYGVPVAGGGRRSLFGPDGLVPGTERAERWLLWPMGIASPGGMRERGRHAVAFVGRRHFDDADLLGRLFEPAEAPR